MTHDRLMYLFAALFGLFGLPLVFLRDKELAMTLGGLAMASLGCFAITMALGAIAKGEIGLQFTTVQRAARPRLFWAAVALVLGAGGGVAVGAGWLIFLEPV